MITPGDIYLDTRRMPLLYGASWFTGYYIGLNPGCPFSLTLPRRMDTPNRQRILRARRCVDGKEI
jgi:hypothetical protein